MSQTLQALSIGCTRLAMSECGAIRFRNTTDENGSSPKTIASFSDKLVCQWVRYFFDSLVLTDLHRNLHLGRESCPKFSQRELRLDFAKKALNVFRNLGCAFQAIPENQH